MYEVWNPKKNYLVYFSHMEPGSERGAGKHAHIGYIPAELEESLLLTI